MWYGCWWLETNSTIKQFLGCINRLEQSNSQSYINKNIWSENNLLSSLETFLARTLILLEKNPGLQLIVVGKVLLSIFGEVVASVRQEEVG